MRIRRHYALYFVLIGPIVAGLVRKAIPGQPVFMEALPLVAVLLFIGLGVLRIDVRRCGSPAMLVWVWVSLCALYALPALSISISLSFQAAVLGAGAPVIGIVFLQRPGPDDADLALKVIRLFVVVMVLQFPLGMYMLAFGNSALPEILRSNINEIEMGKDFRIGQPMLAGYFTTASVNSIATICALGMACSLSLRERAETRGFLWGSLALGLLAVLWMTARRGAFFCGVIIIFLVVVQHVLKRGAGRTLFVSVLALAAGTTVLVLIPSIQQLILGDRLVLVSGDGLAVSGRFNDVFLRFLTIWVEKSPLGNFTGYASGAGKAFGVRDTEAEPAEVGAAMIVAEQGVLGLAVFTFVFLATLIFLIRRILNSGLYWCLPMVGVYVVLFGLFYFKENSVLFPGLIGSLVFWTLPGVIATQTSPALRNPVKFSIRTKDQKYA